MRPTIGFFAAAALLAGAGLFLWLGNPFNEVASSSESPAVEEESRGEPEEIGVAEDGPEATPEPMRYGDDAYLDGLYDRCGTGNDGACFDLHRESPDGSEYEEFSFGRISNIEVPEQATVPEQTTEETTEDILSTDGESGNCATIPQDLFDPPSCAKYTDVMEGEELVRMGVRVDARRDEADRERELLVAIAAQLSEDNQADMVTLTVHYLPGQMSRQDVTLFASDEAQRLYEQYEPPEPEGPVAF